MSTGPIHLKRGLSLQLRRNNKTRRVQLQPTIARKGVLPQCGWRWPLNDMAELDVTRGRKVLTKTKDHRSAVHASI